MKRKESKKPSPPAELAKTDEVSNSEASRIILDQLEKRGASKDPKLAAKQSRFLNILRKQLKG